MIYATFEPGDFVMFENALPRWLGIVVAVFFNDDSWGERVKIISIMWSEL
jgi:hypothetical protein